MRSEAIDPLSGVSRETLERLEIYAALVAKWNPKINLVSRKSLEDLWSRHFVDSAQVYGLAGPNPRGLWADLGSGGGFPGAVIAILAAGAGADLRVTLVESDQRKAAFLRTVSRETSVPFGVLADRIETLPPLNADILSARALAPLTDLLGFAERHLGDGGVGLFPKGETHAAELREAQNRWRFSGETATSCTDPRAVILKIGAVCRA